LEGRSLGLDAKALHRVDDFLIEVCAAIEDQVFRSRVVGECFAQLPRHPRTAWMPGGIEVQNSSRSFRLAE
jgi:hypothetical protein